MSVRALRTPATPVARGQLLRAAQVVPNADYDVVDSRGDWFGSARVNAEGVACFVQPSTLHGVRVMPPFSLRGGEARSSQRLADSLGAVLSSALCG